MKTLTYLAFAISLVSGLASAQLPAPVTNELFVSDFANDRVAVYSADGAFLRSFTTPGLDGPRGIAFREDGTFFVASQLNSKVYHFGRDELVLSELFSASLTSPTGVAVATNGEVHVSSFNGALVCVFDTGGSFLRAYNEQFMWNPNCIAFDSQGNRYVASAANGTVFKFNANENFVLEFGPPSGVSLVSTMSIAIDSNDVLWVSGGSSHNLLKFTTDGAYLGEVTHPDLTGPQGIAFDDRGHLFSSSFFQHQLVEFDGDGNYIRTITAGGLNVPRSIAFDRGRVDLDHPSLCNGDGGDGLGCTDCPCGNNAEAGSGGGCLNSVGTGARLHVFGTGSLAAADLRFELDRASPSQLAVLISGDAVAPATPINPCFGLGSGLAQSTMDGLRCAVIGFRRHGGRAIDAQGQVGALAAGWGGEDAPASGIGLASGFAAGQVRHFQSFYRDSALAQCGTGLNTSQARSISFLP